MNAAILPLLALLSACARAASLSWSVSPATAATLGAETVFVYRADPAPADLKPDALASGTTDFAVVGVDRRADGSWAWTVLPLNLGKLEFVARWTARGAALAAPPARVAVDAPKIAADADIADIKGPLRAPRPWWPWLAAAAAAALAYAAWRRWKNRPAHGPETPAAPALSPEQAAEIALSELEASGLWERGDYAAFYLRLTEAMRAYLEARYGQPATAMTSPEVARLIKARAENLALAASAREVLARADLVKFARIAPGSAEGPEDLARTRELVRATTPRDAERLAAPETPT